MSEGGIMEMFGLVLAFPAVLIANIVYAAAVHFLLSKIKFLTPWLLWASRIILTMMVIDAGLVVTMGAVAVRRSIGPSYWVLHLLIVILGAPALANQLLLPSGQAWYRRWYIVAGICWFVGMLLVFFQVVVGDALFGPDGNSGPFVP